MPGNEGPNHSLSFLREVVTIQNRQRQLKIDQCISCLKRHPLPTPDDIRETITSFVGETRQHIMRHHLFWKEWILRRGMASLIHASHQASIDISRHDAVLGELARSKDFEERVDPTVGQVAQKDAVAYCALVFGFRDTLRKIQKLRVDIANQISELNDSVFNRDISRFLKDLRNNLLHGQVVIPQWELSYAFEEQRSTGSMIYNVKELIDSGKWSSESRRYVLTLHDEKVPLSSIVREHFRLLDGLGQQVDDMFARNVTPSEKDFFDIEDGHKRQGRKQWTKIDEDNGWADGNRKESLRVSS